MSRAVLISIRPKWCAMISSGKKTLEVRKTRPNIETPFKCYIYETRGYERVGNENLNCTIGGNGRGAVIGEFVCDYIQTPFFDSDVRYGIDFSNDYAEKIMVGSHLTLFEILDYLRGKDGYMLHISDLKNYDHPKQLSNYTGLRKTKFGYAPYEIKRPPQSWCYVEELSRAGGEK